MRYGYCDPGGTCQFHKFTNVISLILITGVSISNFSGENWNQYWIGFNSERSYKVGLNSDDEKFGGQGIQHTQLKTIEQQCGEFPYTLQIDIPAFSTIYFERIN